MISRTSGIALLRQNISIFACATALIASPVMAQDAAPQGAQAERDAAEQNPDDVA
ncbi:hypothetical protein [Sphingomonas oleivorans]|uniref:hypothetical protein n=1 Tax=Sphingomonas oleivorans TaxID=1735121 RepID=UPI0013FD3418|nr:hypothetical protein [Sphingomonas oleivorans]